ncbi:MAG: ATP-grasp domain-containing protein [Bacillota bacterium]
MKLLVIGYSTRSLAESLSAEPHDITVIDAFCDTDLERMGIRAYRSLEESGVGAIKFDGVLYASGPEHSPDALRAARALRIYGNPPETLEALSDTRAFYAFLDEADIPHPEVFFEGEALPPGEFLFKSTLRDGGTGVSRADAAIVPPEHIAQRFVKGTPCSFAFFADGHSCEGIGICEQLIGEKAFGAQGFLYNGNIVVHRRFSEEFFQRLEGIANKLTRRYGLCGANGFDFMLLEGGGACLLELNPRWCASFELYERMYGCSIARAQVLGTPPVRGEAQSSALGKAVLYAHSDYTVPEDAGGWYDGGIRDVPHVGEFIPQGYPICTVFASGVDRDDCYRKLIDRSKPILKGKD